MKSLRPTISDSTTLTLIAACVALALAVLGCDSGTQEPAAPTPAAPEASEQAAPADESAAAPAAGKREGDIDPARFPTEMPEGATAEIPSGFPADLPIYPGAQTAMGKGIELEGSPQSAVQFLTNDAYQDVQKYYTDELTSRGWTISSQDQNENAAALEASKDKCKATILARPVEGGGSDIYIVTEC